MRFFYIFITIVVFYFPEFTYAQDTCETKDPLPDDAFDKMIVQDITYAIIGEQTPVSGIKLDISKPEATISGVFPNEKSYLPWDLFGFEFKGGITDRNFSLFKGFNTFNTAFEIRPSFHFIPAWNSAKYGTCSDARTKTLIISAKNYLTEKHTTAVADTFYAVALIKKRHMGALIDRKDDKIELPTDATATTAQKKIVIHFLKKILKTENLNVDETQSLNEILAVIPLLSDDPSKINREVYNDEVFAAYNKYSKVYKSWDEMVTRKKIENAAEAWTLKKYWWFTISPYGRTEKVNEYYAVYEGRDSSYFKSGYQFYYGISGYLNHYIVAPNKIAHLVRFGISYSHTNNLAALSGFTYETRRPFFADGNSVTEITKSGTAYNHKDIKRGGAGQMNLEYYLLPLNTLIPGIYFSSNLNYSDLYKLPTIVDRADDKTQLGIESGLVFNINSREKEKSLLSLLFYFRHEDVTDKPRIAAATGIEESRDDFTKRNLSFGIRVGIPINLPLRQNL